MPAPAGEGTARWSQALVCHLVPGPRRTPWLGHGEGRGARGTRVTARGSTRQAGNCTKLQLTPDVEEEIAGKAQQLLARSAGRQRMGPTRGRQVAASEAAPRDLSCRYCSAPSLAPAMGTRRHRDSASPEQRAPEPAPRPTRSPGREPCGVPLPPAPPPGPAAGTTLCISSGSSLGGAAPRGRGRAGIPRLPGEGRGARR